MATIKDVARLADVSVTTVSHVINSTRFVSEGTQRRVREAVETLRFVPSALARGLKSNRTHTLGVMIPNCSNPFFAEVVRGIEDACFKAGFAVILCNSDDVAAKQVHYLRVLTEKQVDGLVVVSSGGDDELGRALAHAEMPVVLVDREVEGVSADVVELDHRAGGLLAAQHLLDLGHREIACITGPHQLLSSAARVAGFLKALDKAGVTVRPNLIQESDFTSAGGHAAMQQLLERRPMPTAVFAANDLAAIGAVSAAAQRGLSVPGDLSVVGFDDIALAAFSNPPLTTVAQPKHALGALAAELLLSRLASSAGGPRRKLLKPSLTVRASTAEPRKRRRPGP